MSHERLSLVHDRCTTCGSLLPCDLHSRELKRALLSERGEKPGFEMMWETMVPGGIGKFVWLSDTDLLTINHEQSGFLRITRDPVTQQWSQSAKVELFHDDNERILSVAKLDANRLLLFTNRRCLYVMEISELVNAVPSVSRVKAFDWSYSFLKDFYRLNDGSILTQSHSLSGSEILSLIEKDGEWQITKVTDSTRQDVYSLMPFIILRFTNGDLFLGNTNRNNLKIIKQPDSALNAGKYEALFIQQASISPRSIIAAAVISDDVLAVGTDNQPFILHFDRNDHAHEVAVTCKQLDISLRKNSEVKALDALSSELFIAGYADGEVELWSKDESDNWQSSSIGRINGNPICTITHSLNSPDSLFVYSEPGLVHYQIPADKLRAYHERRIKQEETPPLPSDL